MYLIRRERDGRLIAGVFIPIDTEEQARAVLARWECNWPHERFVIENAGGAQGSQSA